MRVCGEAGSEWIGGNSGALEGMSGDHRRNKKKSVVLRVWISVIQHPAKSSWPRKAKNLGKNGKIMARMARSWQDCYALGQDNQDFFPSSIIT